MKRLLWPVTTPAGDEVMNTHLWAIIWMKPEVLSCMKISGMTSARLSTHSKQCVLKMPCSFGRRKNTWLTNLKFKIGLESGQRCAQRHGQTQHPKTYLSINGGKCFDTLFKQIMNLSSRSFFFRFVILLAARLRSSCWSWKKKQQQKKQNVKHKIMRCFENFL